MQKKLNSSTDPADASSDASQGVPAEPARQLRGRTEERDRVLRKLNGSPRLRFTSIAVQMDEAQEKQKKG